MVFGNDVILDILDRQNRANLRGGARSAVMCTPPPLKLYTRWRTWSRRSCGFVSSVKTIHQTVISGICAETGTTSSTS